MGLGGRLDATNIVTPAVAIITRIDFDHENFLGHSLARNCRRKSRHSETWRPVVVAAQLAEARDVVLKRAAQLGCPIIDTATSYRVDEQPAKTSPLDRKQNSQRCARTTEISSGWSVEIAPSFPGRFQLQNALNAVAAARVLARKAFTFRITRLFQE